MRLRLVAALMFTASSSWAAPSDLEAARRTFLEGADAQEAGRYEIALERYARVRAVVVSPTLLFNIAKCHERLGHLLVASRGYDEALALAREKHDEEVEREASRHLDLVTKAIPRVQLRLGRDTESPLATLDGADVDPLAELRVDPGHHRLVVRSEKHDRVFELAFDIDRGARREVEVDLGATKKPVVPTVAWRTIERPVPVERTYTPAMIAGGSALVLVAGAIATGLMGADRRARYDEINAAPTPENREQREDLRSEGTTLYAANGVLLGGAAIAVGLAVYFFVRPPAVAVRKAAAQ